MSIFEKQVKDASEKPGTRLFTDDIIMHYPTLKGGKFWKVEHDLLLLHAVLKYVSLKFLDMHCMAALIFLICLHFLWLTMKY